MPAAAERAVQHNHNGFQGETEEIPSTDPLVAPPPGLGPYTPWSIHVTLAGMRPVCCWACKEWY